MPRSTLISLAIYLVTIGNYSANILSRSSDKDKAKILLQSVVAARRPLTLEEANYCVEYCNRKGKLQISHIAIIIFQTCHSRYMQPVHQCLRFQNVLDPSNCKRVSYFRILSRRLRVPAGGKER